MKKFYVPVLIFVCFAGLYYSIGLLSRDKALFKPVWDIQHYVDISETGYDAHPCTPRDYPPGRVCGNVGWYPGWPLVMKAFRPVIGGSPIATYIILSALLTMAGFIVLYRFVDKIAGKMAAFFSVMALAGSPAGFYLLTGFPYALFLFLFAVYLHVFYSRTFCLRDVMLVVLAIGMSLTYPTGLLFALIPFVHELVRHWKSGGFKLNFNRDGKTIFVYILPFFLGLLILWTYFYFRFDNFFVQLDFQARYHRTWSFPLTVIYRSLVGYPISSPENLVLIWYGLALLLFIPYKIKPELWVLGVVLFLFSPATGNTMSIYRHYLAAFPIYLMIGMSPRPMWFKGAFIAVGLAFSLIWLLPTFLDFKLI